MIIDKNQIDFSFLEKFKNVIESLDKLHHIEIGIILKKNNIPLNENNNGIFINLNKISSNVIEEIKQYIEFIKTQENLINIDESKKETLENIYFKDKQESHNECGI